MSLLKSLQQSLINLNKVIKYVIDLSIHHFLEKSVLVDWKPESDLLNITACCFALRVLFKQLLDHVIDALDEPGCTGREISIYTKLQALITENIP
jgi:hypothetical protein